MTTEAKLKSAIILVLLFCGYTAMVMLVSRDDQLLWIDQYGNAGGCVTSHYPNYWVVGPRIPKETYSVGLASGGGLAKQGPSTSWSRTGEKLEEGEYQRDLRTGAWTFWHEDGSVDPSRTGVYEDGKKVRD
jgi:hypothetical protein